MASVTFTVSRAPLGMIAESQVSHDSGPRQVRLFNTSVASVGARPRRIMAATWASTCDSRDAGRQPNLWRRSGNHHSRNARMSIGGMNPPSVLPQNCQPRRFS